MDIPAILKSDVTKIGTYMSSKIGGKGDSVLADLYFDIGNVWCKVDKEKSDPRAVDWLHETLAVELSEIIDGEYEKWKRYLFSLRQWRFPSGLLDFALEKAQKEKITIHVTDSTDNRDISIPDLPESFSYLGEHQIAALDAMRKHRNGLIKHTTGAGKTEIAVAFASCIKGEGNVIFLANEKTILRQTRDRWKQRTGTEAGILGDGHFDIKRFTVASFDYVFRHLKSLELKAYLDSVVCMFVDEAHVSAAKTYWKVIMSIPAYWRYGLSATPFGRCDGMDMFTSASLGPVLHEIPSSKLHGIRTVPVNVIYYDFKRPDGGFVGSWQSALSDYGARNAAITDLCLIAPKPCLVFFEWVDHGRRLFDYAKRMGINCEIVHGTHSTETRTNLSKRLNDGDLDVLFASRIFAKGIDIPQIKSCINAGGMKAIITTAQKVGRGVRIANGKEILWFFDFTDKHNTTVKHHARERYKTYVDLGLKVQVFETIEDICKDLGVKPPDRRCPVPARRNKVAVCSDDLPVIPYIDLPDDGLCMPEKVISHITFGNHAMIRFGIGFTFGIGYRKDLLSR